MERQVVNKKTDVLKKLNSYKKVLIRGAKIYDPFNEKKYTSDVLIENGYIKSITDNIKIDENNGIKNFNNSKNIKITGDKLIIDASKNILCPAFFDMHVHFRDPGDEQEETIESGINSAWRGGITAVACMPNTRPPIDSENLIKYIVNFGKIMDFKLLPVAAMTRGLEGTAMSEMGILSDAGAVAFTDDGKCVQDSKLMYEIMRYSRQFSRVLVLHEEDYSLSKYGLVHEGLYSTKLGLDGIPGLSEELVIARDIMMAKKTKAKIHITHLSSKGSVELIRKAKEDGINITCDVTPHHLYFDDSVLEKYDANFKVSPPIRSSEDREALIEGVKNGIIDTIASDHAPHLECEKNTTFSMAANGVIGTETLFRSAYTCLCIKEKMDLMQLIKMLAVEPYRILGLENNVFKKGNKANIVILNTGIDSVINKDSFISKSSNSAFIGQKLASDIIFTFNNGKVAFFNLDAQ